MGRAAADYQALYGATAFFARLTLPAVEEMEIVVASPVTAGIDIIIDRRAA